MAKFNTLKVADIRRETVDCVSIAFDVPSAVKDDYTFIPGQYLTLKLQVDGEELRRSYSVCSTPMSGELRVAAKQVDGGRVSTYLNNSVNVGNEIEVMTPMGNFTSHIDSANAKNYLLFAGGSGITPVMSILSTVLAVEEKSTITMIYANRDEESVIFNDELKKIQDQNPSRFSLHHVLENNPSGNDLFTGILTEDKTRSIIDSCTDINTVDEVFICGPGPMMENIKNSLKALNVEDAKIHIEYFTTVLEDIKKAEEKPPVLLAEGDSEVTIIMDGDETTFALSFNGDPIVDAAMEAGVDAPFSCKGAVCCTCKAKLVEGEVEMDQNYALTDSEVDEGYILTCQSHPKTSKVIVDYDQAF